MAEHVIPHFHNDPGVPVIDIGAKEFMCVGATPPYDHPHVFLDMGDDERDHLPLLLDALPLRRASSIRTRRGPPNARCRPPQPPDRHGAQSVAAARHVIVAGAGIAGLASALALARAGLRVTVLEQAGQARGNRRRHPAFAQRHRRADRARPRRAAAPAGDDAARDPRDGRRLRTRDRAHSAWPGHRAPLRGALLDDPPRRPAIGARRRRRRRTGHHAQVRHAGRGIREPRQRRLGAGTARQPGRRRTRHRADRRRRSLVDGRHASAAPAPRRALPIAPPGARWCRRPPCRRNSASRWCISGSGSTRISCIIRSRAAASSTSSPSCTTNGARAAGRRPATATKSCVSSRAGPGPRRRAR